MDRGNNYSYKYSYNRNPTATTKYNKNAAAKKKREREMDRKLKIIIIIMWDMNTSLYMLLPLSLVFSVGADHFPMHCLEQLMPLVTNAGLRKQTDDLYCSF